MKKMIAALWLCLAGTTLAFGQGIVFFHGAWEEALEKAKAEEKPIFVDAFTTWCGPCKVMAQNVFPDPQVGALFNANYVCIKIDMEGEEGLRFQKAYPVSAYPTLYFIDFDGSVLKKVIGAQRADGFFAIGKAVLESIDRSKGYEEAYNKGNRAPSLIYNYIRSLNRSGKPSLRIVNDYLRSVSDFTSEINLKIIYEAALEADSRVFDLLVQYQKELAALYSADQIASRIFNACLKTALKGLTMHSDELVEDAKEKMKAHLPDRAKAFGFFIAMEEAVMQRDEKAYLKALSQYAKNAGSEPVSLLAQIVAPIIKKHAANKEALSSAAELARLIAEKNPSASAFIYLAEIQLQLGDRTGARASAETAKSLAKEEGPEAVQLVDQFWTKFG
ncbi:MAG: thioredoxin family protein [Haliscomenobacter sp.]|nr:thioredoxin family protein [Haliscomenobacter sp.]